MLPAPRAFARLQRPVWAEESGIFACDVYSAVGGAWKRKPEIVVAVHGEGISVYDASFRAFSIPGGVC